MPPITRFAPSPTGLLHVGNVRTALICWLYARANKGTFILRFDDTDTERSKEEYAEAIKRDLKWLGLEWDAIYKQSERRSRYEEIKQKLLADGRMYPCYETQEELEIKRKMQLGRGLPPIYDRAALQLTKEQIQKYEAEGRKPHFRFKLDETKPIQWVDMVRGQLTFDAKHLSDPILLREDGNPTYMLPSAVDDVDMSITHVVRGEDHVTNTAIQIQLFEAMGSAIPQFAHLSLLKSKDQEISKRKGGFDIESLREKGIEPMTITSFFARLGTSEPIEPRANLQELMQHFDISTFSRAPATYEEEELDKFNVKILHHLTFDQVRPRLAELGLAHIDQHFWQSVQPNLSHLSDIKDWWHICHETLTPVIEDQEFTTAVIPLLPEGQWDNNTWGVWVEGIKQQTGRKGKQLFMPLRKALTARETGPELKDILPLIGREKTIQRLKGLAA